MNIVYVEHSGLGNMVMSTPLLKMIKLNYPDSRLIVCCWNRSIDAVNGLSFVDLATKMHPLQVIGSLKSVPDNLVATLISPVGSLIDEKSASESDIVITNPVKIPYKKHESKYKTDLLIKLLWSIPQQGKLPFVEIVPPSFPLDKSAYLNFEFNLWPKKYIVINASYLKTDHWYLKHWGNENYAKLINLIHIADKNMKIVMVGTAADHADATKIKSLCDQPNLVKIICGKTNIPEVANILNNALAVIGNDSGLAHISAALGVRTLTIFTFTNIIKNEPIGQNSYVLCRPCDQRLTCQHSNWKHCQSKGCFDLLPSEVMSILDI